MQWKRRVSLSHTIILWSNHMLQQTKQNKTKNKNKDAPRTTHSVWSNKNIAHRQMTCCFVDEEGMPWVSPSFDRLHLLNMSWGCRGIPKIELLSILHPITSFVFPYCCPGLARSWRGRKWCSFPSFPGNGARKVLDVYWSFYSCRQCWASKSRGL